MIILSASGPFATGSKYPVKHRSSGFKRRVPVFMSVVTRLVPLLGPPLLFSLLSVIFLWQPLTTGAALLPTDIAYRFDNVWHDQPGGSQQVRVPANPLLSDVALYYYPYANYAIDQLKSGDFPLWNPYILAGTPFFASTQAAVLDPVNLLTYTAGPYSYWTWGAWLRLALLGTFTYGWTRALGRKYAGAIAAGVVFMACAFVVAWLNYSVVTTAVWLPALLWATTRLVQSGRPMWVGAGGLAMGLVFLGGHPETEFLIFLFWGVYSLILALNKEEPRKGQGLIQALEERRQERGHLALVLRRLGAVAASGVLGIGIGAVQLLPFVSLLLGSSAISRRSNSPPLSPDLGNSLLRFVVLLLPNFSGNPLQDDYWYPQSTNFNEQAGYFGLLAMALAILGTLYWWKHDRSVKFLSVVGVCAALLAIRMPGFHLLYALPVFNVGYGVRWGLVLSLCGAALCGYGMDTLLILRARSPLLGKAWRGFAFGAIAGLAMLLVVYLGIRAGGWDRGWRADSKHSSMVALFDPAQLIPYWPLLFLGAGAVVLWVRWRGLLAIRATATLLIVLLYCDLWVFGSQYNPVVPVQTIYPPRQVVGYLQQHIQHDRFAGTQGTLMPDVPMLFGLRDLRGYEDVIDEPLTQLYGGLLNRLQAPSDGGKLVLTAGDQRLLQVAGVRYILSGRKIQTTGHKRPYRGVLTKGGVTLYESSESLPRAYVVYKANWAPDLTASIQDVLAPQNDPRQTVVLTGPATDGVGGRASVAAVQKQVSVNQTSGGVPLTWRVDSPEKVELGVTMPAPGYLVLSDSYSPDWQATVDGREVSLFRANAVFRAVLVPVGPHVVAFTYDPVLFKASAAASVFALCVAIALLLTGVRMGKRK